MNLRKFESSPCNNLANKINVLKLQISVGNGGLVRRIAGNTTWLMFDRFVRMGVGVVLGAWVARYLGPERFGALAYALAFMSIIQAGCLLGLDLVVARELPRKVFEAHQLLGTVLRLRVVAGLVGVLLACAGMSLLRPGDAEALVITALLAVGLLLQPADLIDAWFQSQTQSRSTVIPRLTAFLLTSLVRVAMITTDAPMWTFAAVYILEASIALILLRISYRTSPTPKPWSWSGELANKLLRESGFLLLSALSIIAYMRADQLILREILGEQQLGLYSSVLPFSSAPHVIPVTLCATLTPFLVQIRQEDADLFRLRFQQLFAVMAWLSLGISAFLAATSTPLVSLLLGHTYSGADSILAIHAFTNVPVFCGVAQTLYLSITGRTKLVFAQTAIGLCISVVSNLLLIPGMGATGSAYAAVLSFSMSAVLCNALLAPDVFKMQIRSLVNFNALPD